ncbi:UNVERIFIED_CONTAM: hypothetical protein GTU68_038692 [Idotea baltica]|nr:hypothetical protein [Idotea baltica]
MTRRAILIHPDPRLKTVADPVTEVTKDLHALADDMLETMYEAPGIGLAAPQVGVMQRMLVMDCIKDDLENPRPMVLINPRVIAAFRRKQAHTEACLSIPDTPRRIARPSWVDVEWCDVYGNATAMRLDGLWATSVQHQIDHLNGKMYFDHLSRTKRDMLLKKARKLQG